MFKNEVGIQVLERGDTVRIGKGKVLYTVMVDEYDGQAHIESQNTGKAQTIGVERLVLVTNVRDEDGGSETGGNKPEDRTASLENAFENLRKADETPNTRIEDFEASKPSYQEIKDAITVEEIRQNTRTQKGISKARKTNREERTSYSKLILAAIQLLPAVYSGTVSDKVKARRRAKNKLARASRKANQR